MLETVVNMDEEKKDQNESDQLKSKIKTAAKAASGDYIGAAKEALKSGAFKKKLKRKLIKYALMACVPIIIALCAFGIFNGIKNETDKLYPKFKEAINILAQPLSIVVEGFEVELFLS